MSETHRDMRSPPKFETVNTSAPLSTDPFIGDKGYTPPTHRSPWKRVLCILVLVLTLVVVLAVLAVIYFFWALPHN